MIKLLSKTMLNLTSKYTLEKVKLKRALEMLHADVNNPTVKLRLKGGINAIVSTKGRSLTMSQLLESRTFLETFAATNRKENILMRQLLFRFRRIMRSTFEEVMSSTHSLGDMIIRYFENSLVFIANDAERPTQVIKYTEKEELTIAVVVLALVVDLLIHPDNQGRYHFLVYTFNKLSLHIGCVNKYFNFKAF